MILMRALTSAEAAARFMDKQEQHTCAPEVGLIQAAARD